MEKTYTPKQNDPLRDKSFKLAIRMVRLYKYLSEEKREYIISKQIMRCGTSPGAMVREAANAESGLDFIHKLSIAQKEVGETQYWLELLLATDFLSETEFNSLNQDATEVLKLLTSSINTKKKNLKPKINH